MVNKVLITDARFQALDLKQREEYALALEDTLESITIANAYSRGAMNDHVSIDPNLGGRAKAKKGSSDDPNKTYNVILRSGFQPGSRLISIDECLDAAPAKLEKLERGYNHTERLTEDVSLREALLIGKGVAEQRGMVLYLLKALDPGQSNRYKVVQHPTGWSPIYA